VWDICTPPLLSHSRVDSLQRLRGYTYTCRLRDGTLHLVTPVWGRAPLYSGCFFENDGGAHAPRDERPIAALRWLACWPAAGGGGGCLASAAGGDVPPSGRGTRRGGLHPRDLHAAGGGLRWQGGSWWVGGPRSQSPRARPVDRPKRKPPRIVSPRVQPSELTVH
jgi:hypothetical protein